MIFSHYISLEQLPLPFLKLSLLLFNSGESQQMSFAGRGRKKEKIYM